jgi:hypothetical protein
MRRPSIACRHAVHSLAPAPLQHVWISDDLLALAFNRFFRVSCPHQKRHGSHVPGPLEARRRASKRRMTVQTGMYPSGASLPPLFDFGALFRVRETGEPRWRYEAPSPTRNDPLDPCMSQLQPEHGKQDANGPSIWQPSTATNSRTSFNSLRVTACYIARILQY